MFGLDELTSDALQLEALWTFADLAVFIECNIDMITLIDPLNAWSDQQSDSAALVIHAGYGTKLSS